MHDRGGIQWLIKAYVDEFKKSEDVRLLIKVNMSYNPNLDLVKEANKIVRKGKNKPVLQFVSDDLEDEVMRKIYNEGNIFVTTSMADAFNIPVLEAMGCGLPVISTRFGGQSDFLKDDFTKFIDKGTLEYWSKELVYEETKWFKPDISQIRQHLRWAFENQEECRKMGESALKSAKEWTWNDTAKKLLKLLEK
jgi:hypothetical protein